MSLEIVQLVMSVEYDFEIARLGNCATYEDLVDLVTEALHDAQPNCDDVEGTVNAYFRRRFMNEYGISSEGITLDTELHGSDLCLG